MPESRLLAIVGAKRGEYTERVPRVIKRCQFDLRHSAFDCYLKTLPGCATEINDTRIT